MKENLKKYLIFASAAVLLGCGSLIVGFTSSAAAPGPSANGQGTLMVTDSNGTFRRNFSFSAQTKSNGTVQGNAVLHSAQYTYGNGNQPYMVQVDISCMKVIGNTAYFGGLVRKTNEPDPIYSGAVFFSAQDNGEPGKNNDKVSLLYFWDDDPDTVGDPGACQNLPDPPVDGSSLITIDSGNIQVKP
jgi:hypothetical protein